MINPSAWGKTSFGDIARCLTEATRDPLGDGLQRYVGLEHIEPGNIHIRSWGDVKDGTTFTRVFRKGQVLFGKRRAYQKKAALAEFDGICSGDILVCEAIDGAILPELLPFIVQSDGFFDHAIRTSAGSLSPRTKFKDLAKFSLRLPKSKNDQKRIADLLWSVEVLTERYGDLLTKLIVYKNAYFKSAHQDNKKKELSVSEIAEINPRFNSIKHSKNDEVSFVAMNDVSEEGYIVRKQDRIYDQCANGFTPFENGDILFAKITPCMENGKGAIAAGLTNGLGLGSTEFHVLRPKDSNDLSYLFYLTRMSDLRQKAEQLMTGSAGQKRVPAEFFDFYKVSFPDPKQRRVVGERMLLLDRRINDLKLVIQNTHEIKKRITNEVFEAL